MNEPDYPPASVIDRLIEYHRALAESERRLATSLDDQAGIEIRRDRRADEWDHSVGLKLAADKNRVRFNRSDVTVKCLSLLRDLVHPPAPERTHPNRPTRVFTGHMKRPEDDASPRLRLPP
ncbi:hypothetical protein IPV08_21760 [Methylobacterium sp. SD274]|uniref:hypothetical protein n=1 Tax=Methylobacterium sp. SD274 TaxID=2782009 RepID=UPI001A976C1A|nr:hypothetical protein [Methylobacterium sp. SD274]MBO1022593.1 hypothetical protein [Methylobacterium sp. SD274]